MFNCYTSHYWIISQSNLTCALTGLLEVEAVLWNILTFCHSNSNIYTQPGWTPDCFALLSNLNVAVLKCFGSDICTISFLNGIVSRICSHCIRICFHSLFESSPLFPPGLLRNIWQPDSNNFLCNNRSRIEMSPGLWYLHTFDLWLHHIWCISDAVLSSRTLIY